MTPEVYDWWDALRILSAMGGFWLSFIFLAVAIASLRAREAMKEKD